MDRLDDPFEGLYSKARIRFDELVYDSTEASDYARSVIRGIHTSPYELRKSSYVNCWHINEYESELLWSRYSFMEGGVAIQSTYDKLVSSLQDTPHGVYVGKIKYMDWDTESTPTGNLMNPLVTKKKNYQDENELRAALVYLHHRLVLKKQMSKGIRIPVKLVELIDSICISPRSSNWHLNLVKSMLKKYNLNINVKKSVFSEKPMKAKFLKKHPMYQRH